MKTLKISIILFLSYFLASSLYGQTFNKFTSSSEYTIPEMTTFFETASKSYKTGIDSMKTFFPVFWSELSQKEQKAFLDLANQMLMKKMKPFPHFATFIKTYHIFVESYPSEGNFKQFNKSMEFYISKYANKYTDLLELYASFIQDNILNSFTQTNWYAQNCNTYYFDFDSIPKIVLPSLDLLASNGNDSLIIKNTSGVFYPSSLYFYGKKGSVDWSRVGLNPKEVYAEIPKYSIILKSPSINAENVVYYNTKYFSSPLLGTLEDKAITTTVTPETATYPRFTSYNKFITIKNLYDDVDYLGGIYVKGNDFLGQGDEKFLAQLLFKREGKVVIRTKAKSFLLKEHTIESALCNTTIYIKTDSIYHSAIHLRYNADRKEIWLIRGENGSERMPFFNSYHNLEMFSEALFWNLNEESIEFKFLPSTGSGNTAVFESTNFFEQNRIDKLQGFSRSNPMYTLYEFFRVNNVRKAHIDDIVDFYKYAESDVKSLIFQFVEYGFVDYNMLTNEVIYHEKLGNYLLNENGRKDYDILRFISTVSSQNSNASLSLLNYDLTINGLDLIILSDSQIVNIFPAGRKITMQKNRDFTFHGKVEAGLFDFWASNCKFNYNNFKIDLTVIDSIVLYVEDKSFVANYMGEYPLRRVQSYIEDVSGTLYIDQQNNKSSRLSFPRYPYFESKSPGRVYYDHDFVYNGVYDRNRFYYYVDLFTITHMDNYDTDSLLFNGYLYSDGIFPDIHKPLKVRPDFSLGFIHYTEETGTPAYYGKGIFTNKIDLSNQGLRGTGKLDYTQSHGEGKNLLFFLDSMNGVFDTYIVDAQNIGIEYPDVKAKNVYVHWEPYNDLMKLNSKDSPFRIFNETDLSGNIMVSNTGVSGQGNMKYKIAEMKSDNYTFFHHEMKSDNINFRLKDTIMNDYFITAINHSAHIDFEKRKGNFVSNGEISYITFPINMFYTRSSEFEWLMDDEKLAFTYEDPYASTDLNTTKIQDLYTMKSSGNELISIHPAQDSLQFTTTKAIYDLKNYVITAEGVRFIEVADAAVFPKEGIVKIYKRAEIGTLKQSKILANTDSQYHEIFNATTHIQSRNAYNSDGYYTYIDENKDKQILYFDSLWVNRNTLSRGRAKIADDSLSLFTLSPHFAFSGESFLNAEDPFLTFQGGITLLHACDSIKYPAIRYKGQINPDSILIPINENIKDMNNQHVVAAISSDRNGSIYTAFARAKNAPTNPEYISSKGYLTYNKELESYIVAEIEKIENLESAGNVIYLNKNQCIGKGDGLLDLGTNLGRVSFIPIGNIINYMLIDSAVINIAATLNFYFNDECMRIMTEIVDGSYELEGVDIIENLNYQHALMNILGESEYRKLYPDLVQYYRFKRLPKKLQIPFVFADIELNWNQPTRSFNSTKKIGIAVCGEREVNKYVPGIIEIQKKSNKTNLQMYFEIGDDWFYFYYVGASNAMQVCSSIVKFNDILKNIPQKKRQLESEKDLPSYSYRLASVNLKKRFLKLHNWNNEDVTE